MRLHQRAHIVRLARTQIEEAVTAAEKVHDLTFAEIFGILGALIADYAKYAIRSERHPDSDKRGDEA